MKLALKKLYIKAGAVVLGMLFFSTPTSAIAAPQLRLADELDMSDDGYCVDVLGVGRTARADLPLVAHNCLPERQSADRVVIERDGRLTMPAFNACVTAFGVTEPLPGSPLVLRPCGAQESFLPASKLQDFVRDDHGRLRLLDTNLCLTVGPDAAPTFSAAHRWRVLTMETCGGAADKMQIWQ